MLRSKMRIPRREAFTLLCVLVGIGASVAHGADLPCAPAERDTISLDGMGEDWREVPALTAGDDRTSLSVRCNTEGKTLYVEIEAADARVVRTPQARNGEDQIALHIGSHKFTLFPTSGSIKAKAVGGGKIMSTSSDRGFVIELALPRAILGRNPERVPILARFDDCDSAAALKTERSVTVEGDLAFTAGPSSLDSFLEDRSLPRSTVRWQKQVRSGKGSVTLVLAGKYLGMVSDGYSYLELPVADGKDVRDPQLVDLGGDGRQAVLLRYTERGGGGSREVLAAYRVSGTELRCVFAVEVGKQLPTGRLVTKLTLKKHGRGTDLVLEAQPAEGLNAGNYNEAAATDVLPILLPWTADKRATYGFTGDDFVKR